MHKYLSRIFLLLLFIAVSSGAYVLANPSVKKPLPLNLDSPENTPTTSPIKETTKTLPPSEIKQAPPIQKSPEGTSKPFTPPPQETVSSSTPLTSPIVKTEETIDITVKIENQEFPLRIKPGINVYEVIVQMQQANQLSFSVKKFSGLGYLVEEVNGQKNSPSTGYYWTYYINNREAKVGISTYIPQPNDLIYWHYEKR